MIDWTKPIQTRNGRKARVLCTDLASNPSELIVVTAVRDPDGNEFVQLVRQDGRVLKSSNDVLDMLNIPEEITGWVNVYAAEGGSLNFGMLRKERFGMLHKGRLAINEGGIVACIPVKFKVGDGL